MHRKLNILRNPINLVLCLVLSSAMGCASATSQRTGRLVEKGALPRPAVLLIYDFSVAPDGARPSEEIQRGQAIAQSLSEEVVTKLEAVGIAARRATDSTSVPLHALVVKGQFVTINEGSRAKRMLIGFGAGSTRLEVEVQAYQMTRSGLRRITEVQGGARGNRMPGIVLAGGMAPAVGTLTPVLTQGVAGVVREVRGGIGADIDRLAEQFAYKTVAFYHRQGWM
ncbi:MAG: DUF4410 domain-containing protein [Syntrophobacteraceae bacterium]|nr:DUF4410 domain-containing protein [Syntrophobacteraceae bacterium]